MGKVNQHHFPEPQDYDAWVDMGPDQEEDVFTGVAPTFIALLAEAAAVALFVGMVAIWAAIGSGA